MEKEYLFKLYNPKKNTMFSKLSSKDIDFLLKLLENYYISFRDKLDISKYYSFGFEYEFDVTDRINISRELFKNRLYPSYQMKNECSFENGAEITTPILHNIRCDWKKVKQVLDIISNNGYNTERCGGHIHIGSHIMNYRRETWENLFMIWSIYENIITRFLNGEYLRKKI